MTSLSLFLFELSPSFSLSLHSLRRDLERRFWTFRALCVSYKSWFTLVTRNNASRGIRETNRIRRFSGYGNFASEMSKLDVDDILKYYTVDLSLSLSSIHLINFLKGSDSSRLIKHCSNLFLEKFFKIVRQSLRDVSRSIQPL